MKKFKNSGQFKKTHGLSTTLFYRVWQSLWGRCNNPTYQAYAKYGGRGIKCEWNSFEEYRDDMYESYICHIEDYGAGRNTTIDRVDVNGNYSKENCRWSTQLEQNRNRTNNRTIILNNESHILSEWAEITGIERGIISWRLNKGWTISKALTKPVNKHKALEANKQ